jgi:hypothetical protein
MGFKVAGVRHWSRCLGFRTFRSSVGAKSNGRTGTDDMPLLRSFRLFGMAVPIKISLLRSWIPVPTPPNWLDKKMVSWKIGITIPPKDERRQSRLLRANPG